MKSMYEAMCEQQASVLLRHANKQMTEICVELLQSGRARNVADAHQQACRSYGPAIATALQENLRIMGAQDILITCP